MLFIILLNATENSSAYLKYLHKSTGEIYCFRLPYLSVGESLVGEYLGTRLLRNLLRNQILSKRHIFFWSIIMFSNINNKNVLTIQLSEAFYLSGVVSCDWLDPCCPSVVVLGGRQNLDPSGSSCSCKSVKWTWMCFKLMC